MKTEQTLQQMCEVRCTKCDHTVNLAVDDGSYFTCAVCGGEECEANFAFGTPESTGAGLEQRTDEAYDRFLAQLLCGPEVDTEQAEWAKWMLKLNHVFAHLVFLIRQTRSSEYRVHHDDCSTVVSLDGTYTVHETTPAGEHIKHMWVMTPDGKVTVHETTPDGKLGTYVITPDGNVTVHEVDPTLSYVN